MPTNPSEYNIPTSLERRNDATVFEHEDQIDLHASRLDWLTASALGAAAQQPAASIDGQPTVEKVEVLTPEQEVLQFGQKVIALRDRELDEALLGVNPRRVHFLDNSKAADHEDLPHAA